MTDLFHNPANKGKWYGIKDIDFYFYNITTDPEICYDGKFYNAFTIEESMYSEYEEETADGIFLGSFEEYMRTHTDSIKMYIEILKSSGDYNLKPWNYRK